MNCTSTSPECLLVTERFGALVAARLADSTANLSPDICERLRYSRGKALAIRSLVVNSARLRSGDQLMLNAEGEHLGFWHRFAVAFPLVALVVGLVSISVIQEDNRAAEVADVDMALLTDALPPSAYTDRGFAQFLKSTYSARPLVTDR